ncbi:MAG TPA: lipocalin family protein [Verrucomicrobiae bacterium]|nr:lipocalin family protein [Verrucomicrobiae bacterium]
MGPRDPENPRQSSTLAGEAQPVSGMMRFMTPSLRMRNPLLLTLAALAAAGVASVSAALAAAPATNFELSRYLGRWYVIARFPAEAPPPRGAFFEFASRPDGGLVHRYYTREGSFDREPIVVERRAEADADMPSRWRVKAGWMSSDERWVLYVSPDYRYALAGVPGFDAGWMLARDPVIPEWRYAGLLARLAMQGYDVSRFRRVPQTPDHVGLPGYE